MLAFATIIHWLWVGTSDQPEKPEKDVGRGLALPLYAKGSSSVGWWSLLITMIGDMTAYFSLVFGYFFFWTIHDDFPPAESALHDDQWMMPALVMLLAAWLLTLLARHANARGHALLFHGSLLAGVLLASAGSVSLVLAPLDAGMDPQAHVYPAIVWVLVGWTALHIVLGIVMQLYAIARRAAGRLSAQHDIDIHVVALYWHFVAITAFVTVAVIAGFPRVTV